MKTINYLIVELEAEYENERGGLIANLDYNDTSFIARKAKVISAPSFVKVQAGDEVICHHNMFRMKGGTKKNIVRSDFHLEDNLYRIPLTECFMFKRGEEDWQAIAPFCFVKPIKAEDVKESGWEISEEELLRDYTHKGYKKLRGILEYPCDALEDLKGKEIIFSEWSEYEFLIDGELYYKMSINDILGHIE